MMEIDEKLTLFERVVMEDVEDTKKSISSEVWNYSEKELNETRNEAQVEYDELKQKMINAIELERRLELSKKQLDEKRVLLSYREELVNQLMDNCKVRLLEFTKSDEYKEYMKSLCSNLSENSGADNTVLFVKNDDLALSEELKKAYSYNCDVVADENILLGSIKFLNKEKNQLIDESFDSKLFAQKEKFVKNSGLSV